MIFFLMYYASTKVIFKGFVAFFLAYPILLNKNRLKFKSHTPIHNYLCLFPNHVKLYLQQTECCGP